LVSDADGHSEALCCFLGPGAVGFRGIAAYGPLVGASASPCLLALMTALMTACGLAPHATKQQLDIVLSSIFIYHILWFT
jgi:hypothetical protein